MLKVSNRKKNILKALLITIVLLFSLRTFYSFVEYPINSDEVAQQSIFNKGINVENKYYIPINNYLWKLPVELLPMAFQAIHPVVPIAIACSLFNIVALILVILAFRKYLKIKVIQFSYIHLVPIATFLILSERFFLYTRNINNRNIEYGLAIWGFVSLYAIFKGKARRIEKYLTVAALTLAFTSDPYFILFFGLPIGILFTLAFILKRSRKFFQLALVIFVSGILSSLYYAFLAITFVQFKGVPRGLVSLERLPENIKVGIEGIISLFIYESEKTLLTNIVLIISIIFFLCVASLILIAIRRFVNKSVEKSSTSGSNTILKRLWQYLQRYFRFEFISLVLLIYVAISPIIFNNALDFGQARYFIFIPFLCILIFFFAISNLNSKRVNIFLSKKFTLEKFSLLVVALILILSTLNIIGLSTREFESNQQYVELAEMLNSNGVTLGYAPYWDSHKISFMTNYALEVSPVECKNGKLQPLTFLSDRESYEKKENKFFLLNEVGCDVNDFLSNYNALENLEWNSKNFILVQKLSDKLP